MNILKETNYIVKKLLLEHIVRKEIVSLAKEVGIPKEIFKNHKVQVTTNYFFPGEGYNFDGNFIFFSSIKPEKIAKGEEEGHYLHHMVNPNLSKSKLGVDMEESFFLESIMETIGYFFSKLADEQRTPNSMIGYFKEKLKKDNHNAYNTLTTVQKSLDNYSKSENPNKTRSEVEKELSELPYSISSMWKKDVLCGDKFDMLTNAFHSLGYELGEQLYNHYKKNEVNAKRILCDLMQTSLEDSMGQFMEVYKELNSK